MAENTREEASIKIGKKTFLTALAILLLLVIAAGVLSLVVPTGSYDRQMTEGREILVEGSFHFTEASRLPVWRWLTAPVEVLWSPDAAVVIVIILFLFAVSISFSLLEKSGVMSLAIASAVRRFSNIKYLLMAIIVFFFMVMGAVLGTFEENIALVRSSWRCPTARVGLARGTRHEHAGLVLRLYRGDHEPVFHRHHAGDCRSASVFRLRLPCDHLCRLLRPRLPFFIPLRPSYRKRSEAVACLRGRRIAPIKIPGY
jgi:hypothetical protein